MTSFKIHLINKTYFKLFWGGMIALKMYLMSGVNNTSLLKCKMLETPALMLSEEEKKSMLMQELLFFRCLVQLVFLELLECICHF